MAGTLKVKSAGGGYVYWDPASVASDVHITSPATSCTLASTATFTSLVAGLVPASGGGTATYLRADASFAVPTFPMVCEGRLTLLSGTPVTTTAQAAKTSVYFTPYKGTRLALYTNSAWEIVIFSEISVAVPSNTSTPFDLFVYNNSGTITLEAVAWTNGTTRATALTTQDGVYVKSGSTNKRYLGTGCTTGVSGQCEMSGANIFLWNYYNRVPMLALVTEATASWNYTTATYRQANASTANQINLVIGVSEDIIHVTLQSSASNTNALVGFWPGLGLDATNALATGCLVSPTSSVAGAVHSMRATWEGYPGIGKHFVAWLERSDAVGTTTWHGNAAAPTTWQNGLTGIIWA